MALPRGPNFEAPGVQDWTPDYIHNGSPSWHIFVKGFGPRTHAPNGRIIVTEENGLTRQWGFRQIGPDGQPERVMAITTDEEGRWSIDTHQTTKFMGRRASEMRE